MATWSEFASSDPGMAAVGLALLDRHELAYLATVRSDGSPRLHPVSPKVIEGGLYVCTPRSSPKAADQIRDGRYVMHLLPGENDAEFRIRGRARLITDRAELERVLAQGPHYFRIDDYLFEYDIEEAASAHWEHVGQPGTYPVRRSWRAAP